MPQTAGKVRRHQSGKTRLLSSQKSKDSTSKSNRKKSCTTKFTGVLTRLLFLLHTAIALWRVSIYYPDDILYFLVIGVALLIVEMVYTIGVRHGKEYKWFSPSFFFYLLSVVPCLWLLQLNELKQLPSSPQTIEGSNKTTLMMSTEKLSNFTSAPYLLLHDTNPSSEDTIRNRRDVHLQLPTPFPQNRAIDENSNNSENTNYPKRNIVSVAATTSRFRFTNDTTAISNSKEDLSNSAFNNLTSSIINFGENALHAAENFSSEGWLLLLHQILLFVLVIGRWLLPKGGITRDQLSQLLLVFIGVGADILEFVTETLDDDDSSTGQNFFIRLVIYSVWSWSLIQFTLVLTASKAPKAQLGFMGNSDEVILLTSRNCCANSIFNNADVWGILATLFFQDMPFLGFRLYIMIVHKQVHQMMLFFTGKNILVVILQIYRLIVLKVNQDKKQTEDLDQSELQPLRGTLQRLARQSVADELPSDSVIKEASIKQKHDGSITVRISLSDGNNKAE